MPAIKELAAHVLFNPEPKDADHYLVPLTQYKVLQHPSKRQATCWIEASAGQRFFITIEPSARAFFPPLDINTVDGGFNHLYDLGLIASPSPDNIETLLKVQILDYRYLVTIYIDGNSTPAYEYVYNQYGVNNKPIIIKYGQKSASDNMDKTNYIWQFQTLCDATKTENDLLEVISQLSGTRVTDNESGLKKPSDTDIEPSNRSTTSSAGAGKIDIRVSRVIRKSIIHSPKPKIPGVDPLNEDSTYNSNSNAAIDATHYIKEIDADAAERSAKPAQYITVNYIDPESAPYARFIFNYRDKDVLEKHGIKPGCNLVPQLQRGEGSRRKRRSAGDSAQGVRTKRTALGQSGGDPTLSPPRRRFAYRSLVDIDAIRSAISRARNSTSTPRLFSHLTDVTTSEATSGEQDLATSPTPTFQSLMVLRPRKAPGSFGL